DPASPCEVPQGVDGVRRIAAPNRFMQRPKERSAMGLQVFHDRVLATGSCVRLGPNLGRRQQAGQVIGKIERDSAIALPERLGPNPTDRARGGGGGQSRGGGG